MFLHARTYDGLRHFPMYLHNTRDAYVVPSGNDAVGHNDLGLLD